VAPPCGASVGGPSILRGVLRAGDTSPRSRRGLKATLIAVFALLVFAAVALAVEPSKGGHRGKTGQGRAVAIEVGKNHRIRRFLIFYRAKCENGQGWESYTIDRDTKDDKIQQDNGVFSDKGKYKEQAGDYDAYIKVNLHGEFTTSKHAEGRFKVRMRVVKDGETYTTCQKDVSWKVNHFKDEWPRDADWTNPRKATVEPGGLSGAGSSARGFVR
jgi:hypothetical protein